MKKVIKSIAFNALSIAFGIMATGAFVWVITLAGKV
ncbi:hypothetical protein [Erwinia phage Snitter]|nr:hypothetical protein [Erwinia phage Snitter]